MKGARIKAPWSMVVQEVRENQEHFSFLVAERKPRTSPERSPLRPSAEERSKRKVEMVVEMALADVVRDVVRDVNRDVVPQKSTRTTTQRDDTTRKAPCARLFAPKRNMWT